MSYKKGILSFHVFPPFFPLQDMSTAEPDKSSSPVTINAHQSELACVAINHDGTQVATASRKVP